MPDTLNKQAIVNLLIDSPLREPIKINLIDIVNNTSEPDLPKIYSTITKELEIFQKATERRMKLAEETITKLGGVATPVGDTTPPLSVPPLDLPPMPTAPSLQPLGAPTPNPATDEASLAEIQKELDSLKTADEVSVAATPIPVTPPVQQ